MIESLNQIIPIIVFTYKHIVYNIYRNSIRKGTGYILSIEDHTEKTIRQIKYIYHIRCHA